MLGDPDLHPNKMYHACWAIGKQSANPYLGMKLPRAAQWIPWIPDMLLPASHFVVVAPVFSHGSLTLAWWAPHGPFLGATYIQCLGSVGTRAWSQSTPQQLWRANPPDVQISPWCLCWDFTVTQLLPWSSSNSFRGVWFWEHFLK